MCFSLKINSVIFSKTLLYSSIIYFDIIVVVVVVVRPHSSTMYSDAAYCYRPISVVNWSVCLVTVVSSTKTTELIKIPFGLWAQMAHGIMGGHIHPPWEGEILRGKGRPIVKYRDTLR